MVRPLTRGALLVSTAALATACTSGNSAIEPPFTSVNVSTLGKLQFAVGTANIGYPGGQFAGLNTVVTFRKANGGSATAVNSPQIVGPSGFLVPAGELESDGTPNADAGTNTINYTPQAGGPETTFQTNGQATLYGFGPNNYDTSGSANFGDYTLPFYSDQIPDTTDTGGYPASAFYGLPPAWPAAPAGTGFPGYNLGFVDFATAPVSGTYALNVIVPVSVGSSQKSASYSTSATLNASQVLPALAAPTFTFDSTGTGGTLAATIPAGVTEVIVEFTDTTSGFAGTYLFTPTSPAPQTIADGDATAATDGYTIAAAGFDYDAFGPSAPANTQQTPTITGSAGQDDITTSPPVTVQDTSMSAARNRHATIKHRR
jgi:hypothetical protein